MKNIEKLTEGLCGAFEQVKADREFVAQAAEMANIAGKIINAQKVQMEYAQLTERKPEIQFLETKPAK